MSPGSAGAPTTGNIVLDGETVTTKEPKSREMTMVFRNYAPYPQMTAREIRPSDSR